MVGNIGRSTIKNLKNQTVNPLSANSTKLSNTLKQFADEMFECLTILWNYRIKG